MRRILVTGAGTWTGGSLIRRLERRADVELFAVDEVDPVVEFSTGVYRIGIDQLDFAHFVLDLKPHTVVHLQTVDRTAALGGTRSHEQTVLGARSLFAAIGRTPETDHVIVKSDAEYYGSGPRSPSVFREDDPGPGRASRYHRDLHDMESFLAATAAAQPHTRYTVLRFGAITGPDVANPLSRLLLLPVVPTQLGFDPRLQLLDQDDAVAALEHAVDHPVPGRFNVAAPGQLYLSRIVRLGQRLGQPLPRRAYEAAVRGLGRLDLYLPRHLTRLLKWGRVMDLTRMGAVLGFAPARDCRNAVLALYGRSG